MKKILIISPQPFFQWRGSPIRVGFNLLALTGLGYDVDLLTLPVGEKREIEGARIIRVANPLGIKNVPIGPSVPKLFFDLLILFKGIFLCFRNSYEVIHGIEEAGMIAVLLGRMFGAKVIFEKHSDPSSYKKGLLRNVIMGGYAMVERMAVRFADAVIGTGPGLVSQINSMATGTRAFHVFDIPSSLSEPESSNVEQLRRQLQNRDDEVLVTFVGSFAVYQGVELMFSSIPHVLRRCRELRFIVIGGTDVEIQEKKELLAEEGLLDKVSFLGKVAPDLLPDYLAASDILLSPRVSGVNTPLKILDYMKVGRAIVATDVESNRLLLDETTAVLAAPEPVAFADAIAALAMDAEKREALGRAGRHLYETRYNFKEYSRRLDNCYSYVLDGAGG